MTAKVAIIRIVLILAYLVPGWLLNDGYRYIHTVFYKAAVCDEIKCLDAKQMATDMEKLQLPITKERKNESKVQE